MNNYVALKGKGKYRSSFSHLFCRIDDKDKEKKILGFWVYDYFNEYVIVENNEELSKEELLLSFGISPDSHLQLEMFSIDLSQISFIPFEKYKKNYINYLKLQDKKNRKKISKDLFDLLRNDCELSDDEICNIRFGDIKKEYITVSSKEKTNHRPNNVTKKCFESLILNPNKELSEIVKNRISENMKSNKELELN